MLKLYAAGKRFLCRHCNDVAYASQNEDALSRAYRRVDKARAKLGRKDRQEPVLFKPHGMHQRTFNGLRAELKTADDAANRHFMLYSKNFFAGIGHAMAALIPD